MDMKEELLSKDLKDLFFKLSVPAVLGMLVIGLYPLMDGIFAGKIIGEKAMTACSVAMPLTFLNNGIATLIGVGSASILSRTLGKGDKKKLNKVMGNLIFWVLLLSSIIMLGGIALAEKFLTMAGATPEIVDLGVRYLRILFLGSIFVNFTQSANMVMRGEGLMKRAMIIMGLGAGINIILDPIFMKAMGDKGIEGAAMATVLAQFVQAIMTLNYFLKKSKNVKIGKIRPHKDIYKEMFAIGFSAMLMQVLSMIQQTLLYKVAFKYGGENNGILMAASLRLYGFSFIPLWGLSQGLQPLVGTNFGAGKYMRVKETMKIFTRGGLILAALFWLPAQIFPEKVLSLFNVNSTIIAQGSNYFRIFYSIYILSVLMIMSITFFQAIGDGKKAGIIVLLRQLFIFVPAIILVPKFIGIDGVWLTMPLIDLTMVIAGYSLQKKEIKKLVNL